MKLFSRAGTWLHGRLFSVRTYEPTDNPEMRELADRVAHLEDVTEHQDRRLSQVEVRVGIRSIIRWPGRDAG